MAAHTIPVLVGERTVVKVETPEGGLGEEEIANRLPSFDGFTEAMGEIAGKVRAGLEHVRPDRAVIEFGLDVSVEAGQLTALIVKGSGTAHVTVTLEWGSA